MREFTGHLTMKNTSFIFLFAFAALLASSCVASRMAPTATPTAAGAQHSADVPQDTLPETFKADFLEHLRRGEMLFSFFSNPWTFIYHEDNRDEGSTDGQRANLAKADIDKTIQIRVKNDGCGWACMFDDMKAEPKEYDLYFNLREQVPDWESFEITDSDKEGVVYIQDGASRSLVLHYGSDNRITTMEYRSEDPG